MSWGKLRKQAREFICPELAKRVDFHITSYHRDGPGAEPLGRGWITLDGEEIANFSGKAGNADDRQDLYEAIKLYPQLSIEDALISPSYIVRGLALIDRRLGRKRFSRLSAEDTHPFVVSMYELRRQVLDA